MNLLNIARKSAVGRMALGVQRNGSLRDFCGFLAVLACKWLILGLGLDTSSHVVNGDIPVCPIPAIGYIARAAVVLRVSGTTPCAWVRGLGWGHIPP